MADDSLLALARSIVDRLKTGPDFASLADHIHMEDGDLVAKVQASVSKVSIAIIVPIPDLVTTGEEDVCEAVPVVNIVEKPIVNRSAGSTQIRATSVGLSIWNRLRHWEPGQNFKGIEKCRLIRPDPTSKPDLWQFNGRCQLLLVT